MNVISNNGHHATIQYSSQELDVIDSVLASAGTMDPYIRELPMENVATLQKKMLEARETGRVTLSGLQNNDLNGVLLAAINEPVGGLAQIKKSISDIYAQVNQLHVEFLNSLKPGKYLE